VGGAAVRAMSSLSAGRGVIGITAVPAVGQPFGALSIALAVLRAHTTRAIGEVRPHRSLNVCALRFPVKPHVMLNGAMDLAVVRELGVVNDDSVARHESSTSWSL